MLGAFRRFGVSHALRASTPKTLPVRAIPQRLQWRSSPVTAASHSVRLLHQSPAPRFADAATAEAEQTKPQQEQQEQLSRFPQLVERNLIDQKMVLNTIRKIGAETMTEVQAMTLDKILTGEDVVAKAKTGTGKTIAFLLPTIQRILDDVEKTGGRLRAGASADDIRAIVISPTRELAEQIAAEARVLVAGTGVKVHCATGGTQKHTMLMRAHQDGCHLLVGTPGRLADVLSSTDRLAIRVPKLNCLVLDEADRLLDDGFAPELMKIQTLLPDPMKVDRQTLLFSATMPDKVKFMVRQIAKPNLHFVNTVNEDEQPTHLRVPQKVVQCQGPENVYPAILELVKNYLSNPNPEKRPFKAIVYFNTTREVQMAHDVFVRLRSQADQPRSPHPLQGVKLSRMSARLTQQQRTETANNFRRDSSAILFSSDVTARGMDFPNVTHVIQVHPPRDRETYIHRLGRTGRAGKEGEGWTILPQHEVRDFARMLGREIPVQNDKSLHSARLNMRSENPDQFAPGWEAVEQVRHGMTRVRDDVKEEAYLGLLNTVSKSPRNKRDAMEDVNAIARYSYGMKEIPPISENLARKFGLEYVPGVNVIPNSEYFARQRQQELARPPSFDRRSSQRDPFSRSMVGDRGRRFERFDRFERHSSAPPRFAPRSRRMSDREDTRNEFFDGF